MLTPLPALGLLPDALDLVLPGCCPGCDAPGRALCDTCRRVLREVRPAPSAPSPRPRGLPPTIAATGYDDVVRRLLVAHKERGRLALARPLGSLLAAAVDELGAGGAVLVPVPSARSAVRARGHDHALRLARRAARESGLRAVALLHQARPVADQSGLTREERAANLSGALAARVDLLGVPVVVVDDVMTTGATLVEAARALAEAGAQVRGAAVVAAVQRRASSRDAAVA